MDYMCPSTMLFCQLSQCRCEAFDMVDSQIQVPSFKMKKMKTSRGPHTAGSLTTTKVNHSVQWTEETHFNLFDI